MAAPSSHAKRQARSPSLRAPDVLHHIAVERQALFGVSVAPDVSHVDRALAAVAGRQRGCVSLDQLRALGLTRGAIAHRVRTGRLIPLHRGVFAVGDLALPPLAREQAALLAVDGTVLGSGSAAFVWGILAAHPSGPVELASPTQRRRRDGIVVHHTGSLAAGEVTTRNGLLLTSAVRTISDLAPRLATTALEQVVAETIVKRLATEEALRTACGGRVAEILGEGPRFTRAESERLLLSIVDAAGLPRPLTNERIAGWEVDAVWPVARVALEVDGYATHGHRVAWERDHRRDLEVQAAGYRTVRVTYRQLIDEPLRVAARLARLLAPALTA